MTKEITCSCPKLSCKNHGNCGACVLKHKVTASLPFCLFEENGGDKSIANYYQYLKNKFEPKEK